MDRRRSFQHGPDDEFFGNEIGVGLFRKAIDYDELARAVEELTVRVAKLESLGREGRDKDASLQSKVSLLYPGAYVEGTQASWPEL